MGRRNLNLIKSGSPFFGVRAFTWVDSGGTSFCSYTSIFRCLNERAWLHRFPAYFNANITKGSMQVHSLYLGPNIGRWETFWTRVYTISLHGPSAIQSTQALNPKPYNYGCFGGLGDGLSVDAAERFKLSYHRQG